MPRKVDPHKGTKRYVRRHREARLRNVVEVGWSPKSKRAKSKRVAKRKRAAKKKVAGKRGGRRRRKRKQR
jgi:hypothetical protein